MGCPCNSIMGSARLTLRTERLRTLESTIRSGANLRVGGCEFRVRAPNAKQVILRHSPQNHSDIDIPMAAGEGGFFYVEAAAARGDRYFYIVDDKKPVPDPVSRCLPEGVHGRTEIVSPEFDWTDAHWRGIPLEQYLIYELHVGTFTPQGTFDGVISKLDYLKNTLGVSVIELMPVAAFPGERNWGYDGVSLYARQASDGGAEGLERMGKAARPA